MMRPPGYFVGTIASALACLAAIGCSGGAGRDAGMSLPSSVRPQDLNVLVITLDTARADRFGAYGGDVATPAFDALARDGVLFEHVVAVAPLTLPAHASMFTGMAPPQHGIRDNGTQILADAATTLAELLRAAGRRTGAFVGAYVLDGQWGLAQGFDTYDDDFDVDFSMPLGPDGLAAVQRPGNEVTDAALAWLDDIDAPFFAWVHLYDPHTPYAPPEPFGSTYAANLYDGEIAFVDAQIGRLVEYLERRQLLDRTVVVVTGDHGEALGDHGEGTHGFFVYEGVLQVPLVIRTPYSHPRERRVPGLARSADLMPTVLELVGLPVPPGIHGLSLTQLMTGSSDDLDLIAYSETLQPRHHYGWSELRSLRRGSMKFIAAPRPELYDLAADPTETNNLYAARRATAEALADELARLSLSFASHLPVAEAPSAIDPRQREQLRALGYAGGASTHAASGDEALADPKDKLGLFTEITAARRLLHEPGGAVQARDILARVTASDPLVVDAWLMLGDANAQLGHTRSAIDAYERTLALKPDYDLVAVRLAELYRDAGDDDEALAVYARYLHFDPGHIYVRYQVGGIHLDRGDLQQARQILQQVLVDRPSFAPARVALGVVAARSDQPEVAAQLLRAALTDDSGVALAHLNLALLAERRGDLQEALQECVAERQANPRSYAAAFCEGRLRGQLGDMDGALQALRAAVLLEPRQQEGRLFLAQALMATGNLDEAADQARQAIALAPGTEDAALSHYILGKFYEQRGQPERAAAELAAGQAILASRQQFEGEQPRR